MKDKVQLILAMIGLGLYASVILFGFIYVVTDITGRDFNPVAVLIAISLFWLTILLSEITKKIIQKYKNPRKQ